MKRIHLAAVLALATFNAQAQGSNSLRYDSATGVLVIAVGQHAEKRCMIEPRVKGSSPQFNWNDTIVILASREYVSVDSIVSCNNGVAPVRRIPAKAGFVVDVNLAKGIYLALDIFGTTPMSFSATVARLDSTRPVADFPGMYSASKSKRTIEEEAFTYSGGGSISEDGRYVSADGTMQCTAESYPGVWDLVRKQRVVREDGCESLFTR
ncbi:MAG TPA: hypothetical protein VJU59_23635 [Paraburkholderia sp.]|uniref:hypothetical protein n=1 Tax=Paraburkholderia sp. TaxID=1926495 RepID=UPI002B46906C|nr:hypothetical protein [Paraburkholderia sp.]HKR42628.1 hypothetical protein [Paraburkholderia sp.]